MDQVSVTTNSVVLIEGCDILPVGKNSVVVRSRQKLSSVFLPSYSPADLRGFTILPVSGKPVSQGIL